MQRTNFKLDQDRHTLSLKVPYISMVVKPFEKTVQIVRENLILWVK